MKKDNETIAALSRVALFSGLDGRTLGRIAQQTKSYRFGAGDSVIDEDTSGEFGRLYMIVNGTAEARVHDHPVASFGPGDHFGEMSVLDGRPHSAAIVATSNLDTFGVSAWNMRSIIREEPDIAMHLIDALVARLRAVNASVVH